MRNSANIKQRILNVVFGILCFFVPATSRAALLAQDLAQEGDYAGARRESLRRLAEDPADAAAAEVLRIASRHLGEAGKAGPGHSLASLPGRWIVALYRGQIRPAIGHRCSLAPSCSEYFLRASEAHGWLGVPLLADRLVREPGVVMRAETPVAQGRRMLYADPLRDHTFWLRGGESGPAAKRLTPATSASPTQEREP